MPDILDIERGGEFSDIHLPDLPGLEPKSRREVHRVIRQISELAQGVRQVMSAVSRIQANPFVAAETQEQRQGLIGGLAEPLIGANNVDPQLAQVGTASTATTVTSVTAAAATGYTFSAGAAPQMTVSNAATVRSSLSIDDIATKKSNLNAAVAPTVNDDNTLGYAKGSFWSNTTALTAFICQDATTGAAVWSRFL